MIATARSLSFNRLCLILLIFSFFLIPIGSLAQPVINSFSPQAASAGSTVTINGSNFSAIPGNNIVYFGSVKGVVISSTTSSITVKVPTASLYQNISVTVNRLTAFSKYPFLTIFNNDGSLFTEQSFQFGCSIDSVSSDLRTTSYSIGDLDGDGRIDIVTIDELNNTLTGYKNVSEKNIPKFERAFELATVDKPRNLEIGDLDGDGLLDIAVTNFAAKSISIYKNNSSPGRIIMHAPVEFPTATQPGEVIIADFNGDGKPDLAVMSVSFDQKIAIHQNTSNGGIISFSPFQAINNSTFSIEEINAADVDGDNKPDLIVPGINAGVVSVYRNNSTLNTIGFENPVDLPTLSNPYDVKIFDFNNDGKLDLAISYMEDQFTIYRNSGSPGNISFDNATNYSADLNISGIDINDYDGDGKPDLVAKTGSDLSIFKNNSIQGGLISLDRATKIPSIGFNPVYSGDFNNDGKPDLVFEAGIMRTVVLNNRLTSPQIFSIAPTAGRKGEVIVVNGANLRAVTSVDFGGTSAASFSIIDDHAIMAVIGDGSKGDILIRTKNDSAIFSGFVFISPPIIQSYSPDSALNGDTVIIKGKFFDGAKSVSFGGVMASSFSVLNDSLINATIGAGASGDLVVATNFGSDTVPGFTYIARPVIQSIFPTVGGVGTSVNISGINFSGTKHVSFGGVAARSFEIRSSNEIIAVVDSGATGRVTISNAFGSDSLEGFVFAHPPTVYSFYPDSAARYEKVTIKGINFTYAYNVQFGGEQPGIFTILNDSTIVAEVGAGSSGPVTVFSLYGSGSKPGFTHLSPPVINSFSPETGPIGTAVGIKGRFFSNVTDVYFGGTPAESFRIINDDSLLAITGIGATGSITIANKYGSSYSSNAFTFLYKAPTITSFTPTSGGTGTEITITGTNFLPTYMSVGFGDQNALNVVYVSPTKLIATVGNGADGKVTVTTLGGSANMGGFSYIRPKPFIKELVPSIAKEDMLVEIRGDHFTGVSGVSFGGMPAKSFVLMGVGQIFAQVGKGSSGEVTVTTPDGSGTFPGFVYAPVIIDSFSPSSGGTGDEVRIKGSGFLQVNFVKFGGIDASFVTESDTLIIATLRGGNSGNVSVTSHNITAEKDGFHFKGTSATILSAQPLIGNRESKIEITGYGFTGASAVTFGGVAASSFKVNADHSITAYVGTGASGDIVVSSPSGTATLTGFIFITAPSISDIVPEAATPGSNVTLKGFNFSNVPNANIVYFGGVKAAVINASPGSLLVKVPVGAAHGAVSVTVNNLTGYSSKYFKPLLLAYEPLSVSTFEPAIDSATGSFPHAVLNADWNNDGKLEVVSLNSGNPNSEKQVFMFTNIGSDKISLLRLPSFNAYNDPIQGLGRDMDGDGKLDLVISNGEDGSGISIMRNISMPDSIQFEKELLLTSSGIGGFFGAVADFDLDGKPDVIAASEYSSRITIYKNLSTAGKLSFLPGVHFSNINVPNSITVGDMDGDNKPDLICPFYSGGGFAVYRNISTVGTIAFSEKQIINTKFLCRDIKSADFDGDGKLDIAVSHGGYMALSLFRNNSSSGSISFENPILLVAADYPLKFDIGDLDGNGNPELIVGMYYAAYIAIYPNASRPGSISFSNRILLPVQSNPKAISIGDIDGDHRSDIIVAHLYAKVVSIIRNKIGSITLNSFSPDYGTTGSTITIKGTNLDKVKEVYFGSIKARSFTIIDSNTISAIIEQADAGDIQVTTDYGKTHISGFRYYVKPIITSFTPDKGSLRTIINIKGIGFTGTSSVSFGGMEVISFNVDSDSSISARIGTGQSGFVKVINPVGEDSLGGFLYGYVPKINYFSPTTAGRGATVKITGSNFDGVTAVHFGGIPATRFTINSSTSISAVVGNGSTGYLKVTNPFGADSLHDFVYSTVTAIVDPVNVNSRELTVTPNPAHTWMAINHPPGIKKSSIQVIDISGRPVKLISPVPNSTRTIINVSGLTKGWYMILWTNNLRYLGRAFEVQ